MRGHGRGRQITNLENTILRWSRAEGGQQEEEDEEKGEEKQEQEQEGKRVKCERAKSSGNKAFVPPHPALIPKIKSFSSTNGRARARRFPLYANERRESERRTLM